MAEKKNLSTRSLGIALVVAVVLLTLGAVVVANLGKDAPAPARPPATGAASASSEQAPPPAAPVETAAQEHGADAVEATAPEPAEALPVAEHVAPVPDSGAPPDNAATLADGAEDTAAEPPPADAAAVAEPTPTASEADGAAAPPGIAPQLDADGMITVRVSSVPPGARLTVDHKLQGRVPKDLKFKPGTGEVRMKLKLEGYRHRVRYVDPDKEQFVEVVMDPLGAGEKQDDDEAEEATGDGQDAPKADAPKADAPKPSGEDLPEGLDFAE